MHPVQICSAICIAIILLIVAKSLSTIYRSRQAKNSKFLYLFSIQIIIVSVLQCLCCTLRIIAPQPNSFNTISKLVEISQNISTVFSVGIILTISYGWRVAIAALVNYKKKGILKKVKKISYLIVGGMLLANVGLGIWILIQHKIVITKYIELVDYIFMLVMSFVAARVGCKLLNLLKDYEIRTGIKAKKWKFEVKFYLTLLIVLGGCIMQIIRIIFQIVFYTIDNQSMGNSNHIFLIIGYEVANLLILLFCSLIYSPEPQEDHSSSLLTQSGFEEDEPIESW